jgi:ribonuclease BN (tRNA processing enzyme)
MRVLEKRMKIKMLGTGSSLSSLRRSSSSCLVFTGAGNVLIDIGPSVVRRLLEFGYTPEDVDVIVLTHFHPDHTVDLATFLFACNYGERRRRKPLLIIGGEGVRAFFRRLARLFPWVEPKGYPMTVKTLRKGRWRTGHLSLTAAPMNHREESIAVCIGENGKRAVFSGDTAYSPELIRLASTADLLVVECTHPARREKGHLNLPDLRRTVDAAAPFQVVLTHLSPEWEAFHHSLPPPLLLGEDGMEIEL